MKRKNRLMSFILSVLMVFLLLPGNLIALHVSADWIRETTRNICYTFQPYAIRPVIDGTLDPNGYIRLDVQPGNLSYVYDDTSTENLNFDVYASYDEDYIYLFVSTDDRYYHNDKTSSDAGDMWNQSCIQVGFAKLWDTGNQRLEYGIGRNSGTDELLFNCWSSDNYAVDLTANIDYAITVAGGKINYEVRTPVESFLGPGRKLYANTPFRFSLVMSEGQDNIITHTQIASGTTGNGKKAEYFAMVNVVSFSVEPVTNL